LSDLLIQWKGVVEGVEYLHTYDPVIIHGDLKPVSELTNSSLIPLTSDA